MQAGIYEVWQFYYITETQKTKPRATEQILLLFYIAHGEGTRFYAAWS